VFRHLRAVLITTVLTSAFAVPALGQTPASAQASAGALKVFLACERCDAAHLKSSLGFVEFVSDQAAADVSVTGSPASSGSGQKWTLKIDGRGRFDGRTRTIDFDVAGSATADQTRADVARFLKLGLAEYAVATPLGKDLDLGFKRAAAATGASPIKKDQKDPWNYWVYRLGANAYAYGEASSSSSDYSYSASATRTTDNWRLRMNASKSVSKSSFDLDEETTIKSRLGNWNVDGLAVKSVGPRWSLALTGGVTASTYSNQRRVARLTPGVEFDIFPYAESSKRSFTIQYTLGPANYQYDEETIFSKLEETIVQHVLATSVGFRQPWGQAGGSLSFSQQLTATDRTRLSFSGSTNIRIFKSLTLNTSGNYSRIRDQFTLPKGSASEEEVLLRQRQLATGYRYGFNIGFNYAFGALSNTHVNPRFGGG
jgi:hypothetical protein